MKSTVSAEELAAFLEARHGDPFHTLGMRRAGNFVAVRVFRPDCAAVSIVDAADRSRVFVASKIHPDGFFEAVLPKGTTEFPYLLRLKSH
ncbi:MAG: GlgB N-terminal domain-containing protein, partial [Chthoniobacterales bacterium]